MNKLPSQSIAPFATQEYKVENEKLDFNPKFLVSGFIGTTERIILNENLQDAFIMGATGFVIGMLINMFAILYVLDGVIK